MKLRFWQSTAAPTSSVAPQTGERPPLCRGLLSDVLHVFVLTSFAIAQPVYDRLAKQTVFLIDQNVTPTTAALLVFLLSFGLPATMACAEILLARWSRKCQDGFHSLIVFVLLVLIALPICSRIPGLPPAWMLGLSLAGGGLGVWCYFEFCRARSLVTWTAPGILIFPAVFWMHYSPASIFVFTPAGRTEQFQPVPVVMLVFDEFCGLSLMTPDREIDADRFPNFAALAKQSTWYRNAASVNHLTMFAVPAILSGRYVRRDLPPRLSDLPQNLFSVLSLSGGYEIAAFEPTSLLGERIRNSASSQSLRTIPQLLSLADILWRVYLFDVTPGDYRARLPEIPRVWFGWHDSKTVDRTQRRGRFAYGWSDQRNDQFEHFLNCMEDSTPSALYFGHFLLPHVPWAYLPSGRRYSVDGPDWDFLCLPAERERPDQPEPDELAVIHNQQRYLLQLMYVDRLIGQLLSRLHETGILDRCLLIVTADHGVSHRADEPRRELSAGNLDEIASVPLFVKRPHQTVGQISDRLVESVDLFPTVADVVGLKLPAPTDGWSVFDESRPERTQLTFAESSQDTHIAPAILRDSPVPNMVRQRFGSAADQEALFRIGPMPELVGRAVSDFDQSRAAPVSIQLLRYGDQAGKGVNATVPCFFEGTVALPKVMGKPVVIAVAINGIVRAVTRTYQHSDFANRWAAMVPEWSFHSGKNDVRFFVVNAANGQLTPCNVVK